MKILLLGRFAFVKIFIFILVYLKDLRVISPDVLSTTTYGYQTATYCLQLDQLWRPQRCKINDLVSENFRHVTGHPLKCPKPKFWTPWSQVTGRPNWSKWYSSLL